MNKYQEQQKALEADIQEMEVCILRLQNSIARNKVVIAELDIHDRTMKALRHTVKMNKAESHNYRPALESSVANLGKDILKFYNETMDGTEKELQTVEPLTIPAMLDAVLTSLPLTFTYQNAIAACINQWPKADHKKIMTGIYPAVINLKKAGIIVDDGNGGMIYKGAHRS